jgi:hypothetical protein
MNIKVVLKSRFLDIHGARSWNKWSRLGGGNGQFYNFTAPIRDGVPAEFSLGFSRSHRCTCVAAPRSGGSHTRVIIHLAQKSSHAFTHIVKR